MPSSKMQAFYGIIEQNSEFSLTFSPFFVPFFPTQNEKSSSDSGSNVCVGSSSRVQMDTHLSIINMPLSASGVPSWAVADHCVTLSEVHIILIRSELLPSHSTVLYFFCRSLSSEWDCICCKPTLSTGLFFSIHPASGDWQCSSMERWVWQRQRTLHVVDTNNETRNMTQIYRKIWKHSKWRTDNETRDRR